MAPYLSLILAGLLVLYLTSTKGIAALVLQRLPSTIAHELSHWIVAAVLGCRPSGFSLFPKRIAKNHWQLGAVTFVPGTLSAGFVALAPLWVLGSISYWLLWLRPLSGDIGIEILAGIAGGFTALGALPSSTDVEIALRYPVGTTVLAICLAVALA